MYATSRLLHLALAALGLLACATPPSSGVGSTPPCAGPVCVRTGRCVAGRASAQFRAQSAPPSQLSPGQRAGVSVTFDNCSGFTWNPGEVLLEPSPDVGDSPWGLLRVPVPTTVPDGAQVTFAFEIAAPERSGSFTFGWSVARIDGTRLEEPSPPVPVSVLSRADCTQRGAAARFHGRSGPEPYLGTGQRATLQLTFANCSTDTWSQENGWRLRGEGEAEGRFGAASIPLPTEVPPGFEATIPLTLHAPQEVGTYSLSWRVARGDQALEEPSSAARLTVLHAADCSQASQPALFVSQSVPDAIDQRASAPVSLTFANCSGQAWEGAWSLAPTSAEVGSAWGVDRLPLPLPVGSGFSITVPFTMHASDTPGVYPWRFAVRSPSGEMLREASPDRTVRVRCVPQCGDHNCGGDGCGGSCGSCPGGWSCDGAHCQAPDPEPMCGVLQWWNASINYDYITSSGWHDTDLHVTPDTPVQLRHSSRLERYSVGGWGYGPEFTDLTTGRYFRMFHLRPQHMNATNVGQVYPAGFIVGLSGGDTYDTGYCHPVPGCSPVNCGAASCVYSTGAHLCIQTRYGYRDAFPGGTDACR